jgi:hypothetical protein
MSQNLSNKVGHLNMISSKGMNDLGHLSLSKKSSSSHQTK